MQHEFTREEVACITAQLRAIAINGSPVFCVEAVDGLHGAVIVTLRRPGWSVDVPLPLVESERPKREEAKKPTKRRVRT